jgi:hypothetical protein
MHPDDDGPSGHTHTAKEIVMPKTNLLHNARERCWVLERNRWRLARVPKPTGAGALGATIAAQLSAVLIPGLPHEIAAAAGALAAVVVNRWVPTILILVSSVIGPGIVNFDAGAAEAIIAIYRGYLPTFCVIAAFAASLRCGGWLYSRSSWELVIPALVVPKRSS